MADYNSDRTGSNIDLTLDKVDALDAKVQPTGTGANVTGTLTADGLSVNTGSTFSVTGEFGGATNKIAMLNDDGGGRNQIDSTSTGGVAKKLDIATGGTKRLRIEDNGDISFYEDTGTTAKFVWDASTEKLRINTNVNGGDIQLRNQGYIGFSNSADTSNTRYIYANGAGLEFGTDAQTRLTINSSGNVGIGTNSPSEKLDVRGAVNGTHAIFTGQAGRGLVIGTQNTLNNDDGVSYDAQTSSGKHLFKTNGAERMRIDSSGNVGIGTASPSEPLDVAGGKIRIGNTKIGHSGSGGSWGMVFETYSGGYFERARIDSSGNLLVGQTSPSNNVAGMYVRPSSSSGFIADGTTALTLGRLNSDGAIATFLKDGTTVGSIGASGNRPYFSTAETGFRVVGGDVRPTNGVGVDDDANVDLGDSAVRWKDLYLSGGVYLGGTGAINKLDDYESGTFSPTIAAAGQAVTYSQQFGRYVKVGDLVHVQCRVTIDTVSGGSGALYFGGLPFISDSGLYYNSVLSVARMASFNTDISSELQNIMVIQGDNYGYLYYNGNTTGNSSTLGSADIKGGSTITYSGTYKAN